jgi:hypothetical protein
MLTTKEIRPATQGRAALHVVLEGDREVGLLEKYKNTKTETHPWKAFKGIGEACQYLGAFYGRSGKADALAAIAAA